MTRRLPNFSHKHLRFKQANLSDVGPLMAIGDSWKEKEQTEGEAFEESYLSCPLAYWNFISVILTRKHFGLLSS